MKTSVCTMPIVCLLVASPLYAGVAMDLVTTNASGQETERTTIYADANNIRMDDKGRGSRTSVIFLGNEFLVLDHQDKSYILMDEAMLNEMTSQISAAMEQMEKQLASMPPEQRAMAEQMMKGQMGGMMGQKDESPAPRVEATGSGQWKSYNCKNYAIYERGEKSQEVCAASLDQIDGAGEMMEAFRGMATFINKMTESMPMQTGGLNPGELMDQIDGFPVHTVEYANGEVSGEVALESVTEQALEADLFSVPDGYVRQDPFAGRR